MCNHHHPASPQVWSLPQNKTSCPFKNKNNSSSPHSLENTIILPSLYIFTHSVYFVSAVRVWFLSSLSKRNACRYLIPFVTNGPLRGHCVLGFYIHLSTHSCLVSPLGDCDMNYSAVITGRQIAEQVPWVSVYQCNCWLIWSA